MTIKLRIISLCMLTILGSFQLLHAQEPDARTLKEWSKHPHWIEMMADTQANYYHVVAAFDAFWKDRELPVEEDDLFRAGRDEREDQGFLRNLFRGKDKNDRILREKYAFDVKKYRHWLITVEPYVQEDGRILSKQEQLDIWKKQRQ